MQQALDYFNQLNQDYLRVHQTKEELFWQQYMGTGADDVSARFTAAESAYKRFIGEPRRLAEIRQLLAQLENQTPSEALRALQHGLNGWLRFLTATRWKIPPRSSCWIRSSPPSPICSIAARPIRSPTSTRRASGWRRRWASC
ncbi:hypothetical protein GGER_16380 [Serratia rubidaea]